MYSLYLFFPFFWVFLDLIYLLFIKVIVSHFYLCHFTYFIAAFEKKSLDLLVGIQYDLKKINTRLINLDKGLVLHPTVCNQSIAGPSPSIQWNYLPVREEKDLLDLDEKLRNKDTYESLVCIKEFISVNSF